MQRILDGANRYIAQCGIKDFSLVKLCLFSLGLLVGLFVPRSTRRVAAAASFMAFAASCIYLVTTFIRFILNGDGGETEDGEAQD